MLRDARSQQGERDTMSTQEYYFNDTSVTSGRVRHKVRSVREKAVTGQKIKPSAKRVRFWRCFRTVPITAMALLLAVSLTMEHLPAHFMRTFFYPVNYTQVIKQASQRYGVDEYLVCAMILCESHWNVDAQSAAGAQGLMQVMPTTAKDLSTRGIIKGFYSPTNLFDPATNINFGVCYLAQLLKHADTQEEAIAAYNAGPALASNWADTAEEIAGADILSAIQYPETRLYLLRVQNACSEYKKYYPEGITASY